MMHGLGLGAGVGALLGALLSALFVNGVLVMSGWEQMYSEPAFTLYI